ncbi:MAG: hypothetical protein J6J05_08350 [Peptococcaceae bacterium]|nr:hypothetical protein [Peptococcaceae bacterium]
MANDTLTSVGINFREQKEQSVRIQELRDRAARCRCRYCGHPLTLRKITYAAYDEAKIELFCEQCNRIESGAEPEIYKIAEYYVDAMKYDHFPNLDNSFRKRRMNISIICDILTWGFKNSGLLDKDGFNVALNLDEDLMGEAFSLSDSYLESLNKE